MFKLKAPAPTNQKTNVWPNRLDGMMPIVKPRQGGKTHDLLQLAAESFSYIVCPTMQDAQHLWSRARKIELDIPQPITWAEFISGRYRSAGIRGFIIDDLDRCVQSMTHVEIKAVSLTG